MDGQGNIKITIEVFWARRQSKSPIREQKKMLLLLSRALIKTTKIAGVIFFKLA
jgi:hypothetical protein